MSSKTAIVAERANIDVGQAQRAYEMDAALRVGAAAYKKDSGIEARAYKMSSGASKNSAASMTKDSRKNK